MSDALPFPKRALTVQEQIDQLKQRGVIIADPDFAAHYLRFIGYFRLKVYTRFYEHEQAGKSLPVHVVRDGTAFEDVLRLYIFDRELRLIILDAIERIEVAVRSIISNTMCEKFSSHWFMDQQHFTSEGYHQSLLRLIEDEAGRHAQGEKRKAIPEFIAHYFDCNYVEKLPPAWMLCELLSFSTWSKIFSNLADQSVQKVVSRQFRIAPFYFPSWIHALAHLRNICAHHNYCWDRKFSITPAAVWIDGAHVKQTQTLYPFAFIIHRFLQAIAPGSRWKNRLHAHFESNPEFPIAAMGFPLKWFEMKDWQ